ncbi:hypothetical protein AK830_g14 [Neonectria ditissima]|uniref:Uncharacterized protein n=1 Tax=Neonectria ditissima TaxID=78410 RepID=A0A0P7BM99_9HYPO|nr:hypothetical protein AK830_g14 [Neonectria ditissima]
MEQVKRGLEMQRDDVLKQYVLIAEQESRYSAERRELDKKARANRPSQPTIFPTIDIDLDEMYCREKCKDWDDDLSLVKLIKFAKGFFGIGTEGDAIEGRDGEVPATAVLELPSYSNPFVLKPPKLVRVLKHGVRISVLAAVPLPLDSLAREREQEMAYANGAWVVEDPERAKNINKPLCAEQSEEETLVQSLQKELAETSMLGEQADLETERMEPELKSKFTPEKAPEMHMQMSGNGTEILEDTILSSNSSRAPSSEDTSTRLEPAEHGVDSMPEIGCQETSAPQPKAEQAGMPTKILRMASKGLSSSRSAIPRPTSPELPKILQPS